jgi:hypothetical protein
MEPVVTHIQAIATALMQHTTAFTLWRLSVIALLAITWPWWSKIHNQIPSLDGTDYNSRWLAMRWRVVGGLLLIELLICQNVFTQVWRVISTY